MAPSINSSPTNLQLQSPLFGSLPGEIRNEIFTLALTQYEDDDDEEAYSEDAYWYRPDFSAPRKSSSALLRTCKAAYAEGQKLFLSEIELAFWFDRGPGARCGNEACMSFFRSLAPQAVASLQKVRFFTQMYWLEDGDNLRMLCALSNLRPAQITISIRYSDWWCWEDDEPLTMDEGWLRTFSGNPGLRTLKVEYETVIWKKDEMMRIVERNKKWRLPVRSEGGANSTHEGYLTADKTDLTEWTWKGTSELGSQAWSHLSASETVEYVVVTDTWRFDERETSE